MLLINQKGVDSNGGTRRENVGEDDCAGWGIERMTSAQEEDGDKVGRHVAALARRGSPIVLRNRLCLITSNWLAVDNADG